MITVSAYPNIFISGQSIFSKAVRTFGFADEALWKRAADSYEKAVEKLFVQLDGSATGRAVLRAIARTSPRTMLVQPILETKDGEPDAFAKAEDKRGARCGGSDTHLRFTPAHWEPSAMPAVLGGIRYFHGPGSRSDEILLHEIVHGLRHMAGLRIGRSVPFQVDYDTFEEFYAILVTNIYRSEQGRPHLRMDHRGFQALSTAGIHSQAEFYDHRLNKWHIAKLGRQQPSLVSDLKLVKAPFNPLTLAPTH